jgi:hypothetical protein
MSFFPYVPAGKWMSRSLNENQFTNHYSENKTKAIIRLFVGYSTSVIQLRIAKRKRERGRETVYVLTQPILYIYIYIYIALTYIH